MLASACREKGVVRAGRVSSGLRGRLHQALSSYAAPVFPMQAADLPRPSLGHLS